MTTFKASLTICGLSQQQAANYLGVRLDTVKSWSSGRNPVPEGVWSALAELFERIQDAADFAADKIAVGDVDPRQWGHITADYGPDPLPDGADAIAGAMALLLSVSDMKDEV